MLSTVINCVNSRQIHLPLVVPFGVFIPLDGTCAYLALPSFTLLSFFFFLFNPFFLSFPSHSFPFISFSFSFIFFPFLSFSFLFLFLSFPFLSFPFLSFPSAPAADLRRRPHNHPDRQPVSNFKNLCASYSLCS